MPNENPAVVSARNRLFGFRSFSFHGHTILIKPWSGRVDLRVPKRYPWIGYNLILLLGDEWVWQVLYEPIAREVVKDWDELTYEDLWRDPRIGLAFCEAVANART